MTQNWSKHANATLLAIVVACSFGVSPVMQLARAIPQAEPAPQEEAGVEIDGDDWVHTRNGWERAVWRHATPVHSLLSTVHPLLFAAGVLMAAGFGLVAFPSRYCEVKKNATPLAPAAPNQPRGVKRQRLGAGFSNRLPYGDPRR